MLRIGVGAAVATKLPLSVALRERPQSAPSPSHFKAQVCGRSAPHRITALNSRRAFALARTKVNPVPLSCLSDLADRSRRGALRLGERRANQKNGQRPERPSWRSHVSSHQRHRPELHGQDDAGHDRFPRVDRRQLGDPVLAPEGLHAGVHHRARLHGQDRARVHQAQHQAHRPQRRPGREPRALGCATSRRRRAPR